MIPLRGNLNKLISASGNVVPSITTLPEVVVTASRIKNDLNSITNLAYPENVVEDPQQGHYISFYIRVIDQAKLEAFKKAKSIVAVGYRIWWQPKHWPHIDGSSRSKKNTRRK